MSLIAACQGTRGYTMEAFERANEHRDEGYAECGPSHRCSDDYWWVLPDGPERKAMTLLCQYCITQPQEKNMQICVLNPALLDPPC